MMIFSLVVMTGLEKCCIASAYLQWLCHSGERSVARGPLVWDHLSLPKKKKMWGPGKQASEYCETGSLQSVLLTYKVLTPERCY